jgi:hypothetical protein
MFVGFFDVIREKPNKTPAEKKQKQNRGVFSMVIGP